MAEKYTYADVIIDPNDPRVEVGAEYYYCDNPSTCLERANKKDVAHLAVLEKVYPDAIGHFFIDDAYSICIIRKKEPVKKYVPFDLTKEEDRARLRGAWIRKKEAPFLEQEIAGLSTNVALVFLNDVVSVGVANLLEEYEFVDGSPCGKPVEEE